MILNQNHLFLASSSDPLIPHSETQWLDILNGYPKSVSKSCCNGERLAITDVHMNEKNRAKCNEAAQIRRIVAQNHAFWVYNV